MAINISKGSSSDTIKQSNIALLYAGRFIYSHIIHSSVHLFKKVIQEKKKANFEYVSLWGV